MRAFATCHSLQRYNNELSGRAEEKHLFEFADAKYIDEDCSECLEDSLKIKHRIYFKEKDKKLAVLVELQPIIKPCQLELVASEPKFKSNLSEAEQKEGGLMSEHCPPPAGKEMVIFVKGPVERIIEMCS
jgi:magnesium-transporting ATPase (P-type)